MDEKLSGSPPPSGHGKLKLSAASEKETVQVMGERAAHFTQLQLAVQVERVK